MRLLLFFYFMGKITQKTNSNGMKNLEHIQSKVELLIMFVRNQI
jgi:hypothetical protein